MDTEDRERELSPATERGTLVIFGPGEGVTGRSKRHAGNDLFLG